MKKKWRVLLSNDDGIEAEGLKVLHDALRPFCSLTVVAPLHERSATSHSISLFGDVVLYKFYRHGKLWGYALDGTPADCVKLALSTIMKNSPPHLVISGINRGQNTGTSVMYSGTVAAAMEAAIYGFPGMAVSLSCNRRSTPHFEPVAQFVQQLVPLLMKNPLPPRTMLNVNCPNVRELKEVKGIAVTRQGDALYLDFFERQRDVKGAIIFKNIGEEMVPSPEAIVDLDDVVLRQQKISITPLHYDMTNEALLNHLGWVNHILRPGRAKSRSRRKPKASRKKS